VGLIAWWVAMASAPRYSFGASQDMGNNLYYPVLLGAAAIGGWIVPARAAALIGAALGAPGVLLSPWTAPRGDNDGLWVLIIPTLGVFTMVLGVVATFSARGRGRITRRA
jgi:hypothetical protein